MLNIKLFLVWANFDTDCYTLLHFFRVNCNLLSVAILDRFYAVSCCQDIGVINEGSATGVPPNAVGIVAAETHNPWPLFVVSSFGKSDLCLILATTIFWNIIKASMTQAWINPALQN